MTRRGQWLLLIGIIALIGAVVGVTTYGLRDEIFPVDVGAKAPEFDAVTLFDHEVKSLSQDYKGQVILLNVWATWCLPCRQEMPSLEKLYREFGPKGFKVVAVNVADPDATDSTIMDFAKHYGLTFDILRDMPEAGEDSLMAKYKVTGFPESFVIDKDGMIRKKWANADDWSSQGNRSLIASLLGLPVPAPLPEIGDTAIAKPAGEATGTPRGTRPKTP
jgi:cytochrome c biogenesis protein CcmG, thiol:disulfide interchange protein DsbE